ncbi:MAG: Mut7-C ubiquitin/RNAse domain-containing protein [Desulfobacterales bacterium]|nr:Mut7-C ubiquitin/RNAse domain-containing protein [Desulfobacterales bacterium]
MGKHYQNLAQFRFYEELNDFLPPSRYKLTTPYYFNGHPSIKGAIEAQGVPHTEVDLILVNGRSVGFDYHLMDEDSVSVYPVFENVDISPIEKLRDRPLRNSAFILDVHLGKLARLMRMLGFDVLYRNDYDDPEIIDIGVLENRIILTRDRCLLYAKVITHGYRIRSFDPETQLKEVLRRFDLYSTIKPFKRCMSCNGHLCPVDKHKILDCLEPKTKLYYHTFHQCTDCGKIYWKGSHYEKMLTRMEKLKNIAL